MDFEQIIGGGLARKLAAQGIVTPTDIQRRAIPIVLTKQDVIAQSPTGSGKTLAYLLPVLRAFDPDIKAAQALVVAPTYELAAQISKVAQGLAENPADVALLIGSASKARQLDALKKKPRLVVGSVGRILELISEKRLSVHYVRTLVFDEADRLINEEGLADVAQLIKSTLKERQILLFSAKMPNKTIDLAMPLLKNPVLLRPQAHVPAIPPNISHFFITASIREKFDTLRKLAHSQDASAAIVFVNSPFTIEKVAQRLNFHKLSASPLYGAADKLRRKKSIDDFRAGRVRLLVASDIAARGLDVSGLSRIINLDLPGSETDYLHRAGRCGRMDNAGCVISIVTPKEAAALHKFAKRLGFTPAEKFIVRGELADRS